MSDIIVIKPISVTDSERSVIKEQKYAYINRLNFSGAFYNPIRFVSVVLNNMIEHLGKTEPMDLPIGGFYAHSFDFEKIRAHSIVFFDSLEKGGVSAEVIQYIKDLHELTLVELAIMTDKSQKEFEAQQAAKGN